MHHLGENSKSAAKSLLEAGHDDQGRRRRDGGLRTVRRQRRLPLYRCRTITCRSCRRRTTARSTGNRASAPAPTCSTNSSPASAAPSTRIPNYFKSDKGWFDRVEFLAIKDVTARTNALTLGRNPVPGPLRPEDARPAEAEPERRHLRDHGLWPLHLRDERDGQALRQSRCPQRHQVFDRTARTSWTRCSSATARSATTIRSRRRSSSPSIRSRATSTIPRRPRSLLKKAGLEIARLRSLGRRCRLHRRRRCGDPVEGACQGLRHRHQRHPRAGRRLLGQCLAEEAFRRLLLERPSDVSTGCSPRPMPRMPPGTTRSGRTRASTSCWWRPAPRPTKPSARRCMPRCSSWCMTTAA